MELIRLNIPLPNLLLLQWTFCLFGIAYNGVSYFRIRSNHQALTPTPPLTGTMFLLFYGACLIAGHLGFLTFYRWIMLPFVLLFGYFGVYKHFTGYAQKPNMYVSGFTCFVAMAINAWGTLLNIMAVTGRFITQSI